MFFYEQVEIVLTPTFGTDIDGGTPPLVPADMDHFAASPDVLIEHVEQQVINLRG